MSVVIMLLVLVIAIGYPLCVTYALARIAWRRRGAVAGVAVAVMTIAAWVTVPLLAAALSVPVWLFALWLTRGPHEVPPELPRAEVV